MRISEDDFQAARDDLIRRFRGWRPATAVHDDADILLDYKYWYGNGEYLCWTETDVEDFMLGWVPRKVMMPDDLVARTADGIRDFLTFLGETGRLDVASDPLEALQVAVASCTPEMIRRCADPAYFGMGKSLMAGLDPFDDEPHTVLPARAPADEDLAREIARDSPVFRRLCILHDYFAEPRKLTAKGNLTLVDARLLVDALGTGDRMDEVIGDRRFKTKSSAELTRLVSIVGFAVKAKVLRRYAGKLVTVKSWAAKRSDPLGTTLRFADLMFDMGPFAFHWADESSDRALSLVEVSIPSVMAGLYEAPLVFDGLAARLTEMAREDIPRSDFEWRLAEMTVPTHLEWAVTDLEDLGLVVWQQAEVSREYGRERRRGGVLVPTELGVHWCQARLPEYGFAVPIGNSPTLDDPDDAVVQGLGGTLAGGGPDAMMSQLMALGDPDSVAASIERWWMVEHPSTDDVLGTIESASPWAKVRRAAHRALFKHRNI